MIGGGFSGTNNLISFSSYRELSCTFAGLCRVVDQSTTDMQSELKTIEHALGKLESVQTQIKVLRNKSNYIGHELDVFEKNYIKTN